MTEDISASQAITIILTSDSLLDFKTILNIGIKSVNQSLAMVQSFHNSFDPQTGKFDFAKAKDIAKSHKSMAIINTMTKNLHGSKTKVYLVAEQVQNLINMAIGAATENPGQLATAGMALMNLNAQKNGSWFKIYSESTSNIHYQYSLFQITQNKNTGSVLSGALSSLEVQLSEASANLLNLSAGDQVTYDVNYKAITIVEPLSSQS
ncbi:MAG: type-2Aa cytolytic delta-endotoxin [Symploca sp. SIO1C2]|nr:type-2Aa cytolytic delta-endotoxin [Symploca sp. SIO1C2]